LTGGIPRAQLIGMGAALGSVASTGSSFPALAEISGYPLAGGQVIRYLIGGSVMLALLRWKPGLPRREDWLWLFLASLTGLTLFNVFSFEAVKTTDPGTVGVIVGVLPIAVAISAPLLARRRPQLRIVACACAATVGAAMVQQAGGDVTTEGVLLALGAMVCEVAFILLAERLMRTMRALTLAFWTTAIAIPTLILGGLLFEPGPLFATPSREEAAALVYLGLAVTVLALTWWSFAIKRLGSERFSLFAGAMPVAALVTSIVLGLSPLTFLGLAGCLVVAVAIALGNVRPAPAPVPALGTSESQ
jgi:drug/metabolite transporter (DMT)-like permease